MAAILVLCLGLCCSSCLLAAGYLLPLPQKVHTLNENFDKIADGRIILDRENKSFKSPPDICATNCDIDFSCKGFEIWEEGNDRRCLKFDKKPNPWLAFPGWLAAGKRNPKIFIKKE